MRTHQRTLQIFIAWLGSVCLPLVVMLGILYVGAWPQFLPLPHQASHILVLSAIAYWTLRNPQGFSWGLMCVIAIFADALAAQPQGTSLIVWAVCLGVAHQQKRFLLSQKFLVVWAMLGLLMLFALQFTWVLTGLFQKNWGQWWLWIPAWLWGMALMPLIMIVIEPYQKHVQRWQTEL